MKMGFHFFLFTIEIPQWGLSSPLQKALSCLFLMVLIFIRIFAEAFCAFFVYMNKYIILFLILLVLLPLSEGLSLYAQIVTDSIWSAQVKTVVLCRGGVEGESPVLSLGSEDRLLLRFDVLDAEVGSYRYRIEHCDSRWQRDELDPYEYINGFEEEAIEGYNSSFTTLTDYVNYFQYIPGKHSQLLVSGNYVVTVFDQEEPDRILFTRRFYVTEGSRKADVAEVSPYDGGSVRERREVDVTVSENRDYRGDVPWPTLNPAWCHVLVQQNGRTDNMRWLPFGGFEGSSLCYRHKPENVFACGNTFRWFDISNIRTATYNVAQIADYGGEWYATLKPLEDRSKANFIAEEVLCGGMKVNVWDRTNKQTEADYVWVYFMLPMRYPFMNGSVHVAGELTNWCLDEHSRMEYRPDLKAYTLRLHLKQGYYSYQLLFVPVGETEGATNVLEGDHFETPNRYTAFVYYRGANDRYDRLVAIGRSR